MGPTLSFRGIDNAAYYRLVDDDKQYYMDYTGTGNSLNVGHPHSLQLIMDSLRYWVTEMHVDGFRFDLAVDAGPRVLRRRPAVRVLRTGATGSDRQPGEADRRAVGRRPGRLPGRQLPAAVDRVERQVPRHRPRLLARRGRQPRRVRLPADRVGRPLRAHRAPAGRVDQLRHRARRLHVARPGVLQREAQRRQRRGQQRRREQQPVRGTAASKGPTDDPEINALRARQQRNFIATTLLSPGRADDLPRRRARPHPGRQQQRLLPGQRDHLDRLGQRRHRAAGVHRSRCPRCGRRIRCSAGAGSSTGCPVRQPRLRAAAGHLVVPPRTARR